MRRCALLGIIGVAIWILATPAFGSSDAVAVEHAKRLAARGLAALQNGQPDRARRLLEEATQRNPSDANAFYYEGLARRAVGDAQAALASFEHAALLDPDFLEAHLERGATLVELKRPSDALAALELVGDGPELQGRASLFRGVALLRLGQLERARAALREATRVPALAGPASYYAGVAAYRAGDLRSARLHLARVEAELPGSGLAREARALGDRIESEQPKRWSVAAFAGVDYDSNPLLAPLDDAIAASFDLETDGDFRFRVAATGLYDLWHSRQNRLTVGYQFGQNAHLDFDELNLQGHSLIADLELSRDSVHWGLATKADLYLLRATELLDQVTLMPWLTVDLADWGTAEISARLRRRDFRDEGIRIPDSSPTATSFEVLDAWSRSLRLGHSLDLRDDMIAWAGYRFERSTPELASIESRRFGFDGHELDAGFGWSLAPRLRLEGEVLYGHQDYLAASGSNGRPRRADDRLQFAVAFLVDLADHWALIGGFQARENQSNQDDFEYRRFTGSLGVEVRL